MRGLMPYAMLDLSNKNTNVSSARHNRFQFPKCQFPILFKQHIIYVSSYGCSCLAAGKYARCHLFYNDFGYDELFIPRSVSCSDTISVFPIYNFFHFGGHF